MTHSQLLRSGLVSLVAIATVVCRRHASTTPPPSTGAAARTPLGAEILSFDRYNGHPSPSNQYHYHIEPVWLTASDKAAFIGVLLDGFPVYGPQDGNGITPTDLDSCNGHMGATSDYPQ